MNPWSEYGCGLRAALVTDRRPCDLIPSMEQSMDGSCTVGGVDAAASPSGIDIELGMLAAESDCPKSASAEEGSGVKEKDENELLLRCDEEVDYDDDDAENSSSAMQDPAPAVDSEVIKGQEGEGDCEKGTNRQADMATRDDIQKKEHPLYALRRNPKRSQRFIDEEYTLDISTSAVAPSAIAKKSSSIFNEKARACTECGKEFSSWKALFGHMRCHPEREWRGIQRPEHLSHYQQQDKLSKSSGGGGLRRNSNKEPKPPSLVLDLEELETTTTFMKVASDNESDTESIEAAYMNGCCSGSSKGKVTGKRSKRPRQTVVSVVSSRSCLQQELAVTATTPTEIKEERDMANCLVMLACAGRRPSNSLGSVQSQEDEEDEDSSTNDMNGNGGDSWSSDEEDEEEGEVTGLKKSRELDQDQQQHDQQPPVLTMMGSSSTGNGGLSTVVIDNSSLFCGGGNGGGELLDQEIETSGGSASGVRMAYECSTCKRIFKSHQALGGHRASHKKVKGCFARTNLGSDGMVQEGAEEEVMDEDFLRSEEQLPIEFHQLHYHHSLPVTSAMGAQIHHPGSEAGKDELGDTTFSVSSSRKLVKGHECSICHRVFTSGQALGGHKRCHWGGTERVVDSTSSVTASKPGGLFGQLSGSFSMSRTGSVVKEEFLDLNLPAPMEDEDGEDGEEEDAKIKDDKDSSRNKNKNSPKNDMEMVYKLPQLVPASALKRNAGAMSSFNAYLDIDKSHLHKDVRRKVVVEQQQQHPDKTMSGDNEAELRCFRCDVCKCVFSSTESLNSHHNVEHTAGLVASTISGLTPISAS